MKTRTITVVGFLFISLLTAWASSKASYAEYGDSCYDYVPVYVRGSGQELGDKEELAYFKSINKQLEPYSYKNLSVGQEISGVPHSYLAVPVGWGGNDRIPNTVSAELNWTESFGRGNYPSSVKSGVDSLKDYFSYQRDNNTFDKCPHTRYVLGGYSQGAEVVGNFLPWLVENDMDKHISFVALFGDPKYKSKNLFNPLEPLKIYNWYRGNIAQDTTFNGGVNDPRNPYIPNEFEGKVGSWCNANDGICNGNALQLVTDDRKEHKTYPDTAMPAAAKEIAVALKNHWARNGYYTQSDSCGTAKQDIALVVDTSPSMRKTFGPFDESSASAVADGAFSSGCSVRVAIVSYGQPGSGQQTVQNFTDSKEIIKNMLMGFKDTAPLTEDDAAYSARSSEAREGLIHAMDRDWRDNAAKAAIVISNMSGNGLTPHHNSYVQKDIFRADPLTQQVFRSSYEKGGVEIYAYAQPTYFSVDTSSYSFSGEMSYTDYFEIFSAPTGGTYHAPGCYSTCTWSNLPFPKIGNKPQTAVKDVTVEAGEQFKLTALDVSEGVISRAETIGRGMFYNWYLSCGNLTNTMYSGKDIELSIDTPQSCTAALATKANPSYCYYCNGRFAGMSYSGSSLTTFRLTVLPQRDNSTVPPERSKPEPVSNVRQYIEKDKTTITWDPPANSHTDSTVYVIRDRDGSYVGALNSTQLIIHNLPRNNADLTIQAFNNAGASAEAVNIDNAVKTEAPVAQELPPTAPANVLSPLVFTPTKRPLTVVKNDDHFNLSLDSEIMVSQRTSTAQTGQPLDLPAISDPIRTVATIQSQPASPNSPNESPVTMPGWLMATLLLIFASAGIRLASISIVKNR